MNGNRLMRMLKIIGNVAFGLWMVWISVQILRIEGIAVETCGIAWGRSYQPHGALQLPVVCPDLGWDETKRE